MQLVDGLMQLLQAKDRQTKYGIKSIIYINYSYTFAHQKNWVICHRLFNTPRFKHQAIKPEIV